MDSDDTQNYWDFGLCPSSGILETRKQHFGNWNCFCPQVKGEDTYSIGLALSKGPDRVGVFPPSPEDGNRSRFQNIVFSSF
jgi:hypothetical protein